LRGSYHSGYDTTPAFIQRRIPLDLPLIEKSAPPREIYTERLAERTKLLKTFERRQANLGALRLLIFLAAAAILWYTHWYWIAAPAALFIILVWLQAGAEREAECTRRAIRFYERGIARFEHRWQTDPAENGQRFTDAHHPCAADLDLFGRASLFQLLSTARTRGGEERLADWLKSAAPVTTLRDRHEAITELRPLLDLRESLAILGDDIGAGTNPSQLIQWASAAPRTFPAWKRATAPVLAAFALAALVWFLTDNPDARIALIAIGLIEAALAVPLRTRVLDIVTAVEEPAHDLDLFAKILATLETQQFHSPLLATLRQSLDIEHRPASARIAHLRKLIEMLESRENPIVRALGPIVLWTTQLAMAIEAWRVENGPYIAAWLNAVSEIEALSALASYAWEHPADPFPEFREDQTVFEGEDMGHPLLHEDRCVRNTVRLHDPLHLLIVSGSNMSGKSTLLRTIGVNATLALAGAPVRAKCLTLSPLSLGASIQTTDSLEDGQSRFMAEILRLKQILELPQPALFLLDELLGGTNSHDRAVGSEGLIRALLARGAIGLVTTHDLSLARVAEDLAPAAANVHFEDRLENGRLVFDYTMREGIVTRSNALDLMRAVGLDV
jgi:hypothetical protein